MFVVPGQHERAGYAVDHCGVQAENGDSNLPEGAQPRDHQYRQENHEWNDNGDEEQYLPYHGMSWRDSHCDTFTAQAEPRSRADHPGEKAGPPATAAHSERFGCQMQVGLSGPRAPESPRWAVPHLPTLPGPCDVQWIHPPMPSRSVWPAVSRARRVWHPGAMPSDDR